MLQFARYALGGAALRAGMRATVSAVLLALLASPALAKPLIHKSSRTVSALALPHTAATRSTEFASRAKVIPSYARQTGLACSACHFQFPQLTPFGRIFKLNGYTMTGLKMITANDSLKSLNLSPIAPASVMIVSSLTHLSKTVPGTQNDVATFPQEASLFFGAAIAPRVGVFSQFTYSASEARIGIDNVDIRFANHQSLAGRDLLYGITLHNNPTVQDVYNTVPAWGWPFMSSDLAPSSASALIDGGLAQSVVGLGAYTLFNNLIYAEFTAYRSSPQGRPAPFDSSVTGMTHNFTPYWRVALQHDIGSSHLMIGSFGLDAKLYAHGISGMTDRFTDIAADAQFETSASKYPVTILRAAYIHERQRTLAAFDGGEAQNLNRNLNILRSNVTLQPSIRHGLALGFSTTSGTSDSLVYAPNPIDGSRRGAPNSTSFTGEYQFNAWQNVRLGLQYQMFTKFNGSSSDYDGHGRKASDNNMLYLFSWIVF